jgi:hypothetical protein
MFARALVTLFLVAGCTREPAQTPPESKQKPDTAGVEGHGGIAVVEPKAGETTASPTPSDCGGGLSAKELYLQGYSMKETEVAKAVVNFRKVVECTKPADEWHQKALVQIRHLGN